MIDIDKLAEQVQRESPKLIVEYGEALLLCLLSVKLRYLVNKSKGPTLNSFPAEVADLLDLHEKRVLGWTVKDETLVAEAASRLSRASGYPEQEDFDAEIKEIIKKLKANAIEPSK